MSISTEEKRRIIKYYEKDIEDVKKIIDDIQYIDEADVVASASMYGFKFFEIRLTKKGRYTGTVNIPLSVLKELNVTKTLNGFKKVRSWLDSPEGLEEVKQSHIRTYERRISDAKVRIQALRGETNESK
jgi:hypothetical protein